jgi:hypothetical protein
MPFAATGYPNRAADQGMRSIVGQTSMRERDCRSEPGKARTTTRAGIVAAKTEASWTQTSFG